MNFRNWESRKTRDAWGTGYGSPSLMIVACLVINLINFVVMVAINATIANEPGNDYTPNFGWGMMAPAPSAGLIWSIIDVGLCTLLVLHPVYYLVEAVILGVVNAILGGMSIGFFSWHQGGSWVPGMFFVFAFFLYAAITVITSMLIHKTKQRAKRLDLNPPA